MIEISINGDVRKVSGKSLAAVLAELQLDRPYVATALNGEFVPRGLRAETEIREGDAIEVVAPMQGG
jgi:sulfur carrier protein